MDCRIAGDTQGLWCWKLHRVFLTVTGRVLLFILMNLSKKIVYALLQLVEEARSSQLALAKADCRKATLS